MNILVTGATGFIGRALYKELSREHKITVLSRNIEKAKVILGNNAIVYQWDAQKICEWPEKIKNTDAVINLAGENIATNRWTKSTKEKIITSRINALKVLLEAINKKILTPKIFIQASAIGYYGTRNEEELDENSKAGGGFLAEVCKRCEHLSKEIEKFNIRLTVIRSGIVLGADAGALEKLIKLFKVYLGGYFGNGEQWFSWISITDEVAAIKFLIENENLKGIYNLTAPNPVRYKAFCTELGRILKKPCWLHMPAALLRLLTGQMADEMLLSSAKVYPKRLLDDGFQFRFPDITSALKDILSTF